MDIDFKPLIEYLDEKFGESDKRFEAIEGRLTNLETAVANLAAQVKTYHEEMIILTHRVERN